MMAGNIRNRRFCQEDLTGIDIHPHAPEGSLESSQSTTEEYKTVIQTILEATSLPNNEANKTWLLSPLVKEPKEGLSIVAAYPDASKNSDPGYSTALLTTEEKTLKILDGEKKADELLNEAWTEAEATLDLQKDFGHLNCLSTETKIALRAYTIESPFYREFNSKTRNLGGYAGWTFFYPYQSIFLLLFRAVISAAGEMKSTDLFRGMNIMTEIEIGSVIKFSQFTSTTSSREVATDGFSSNGGTLFIFSGVKITLSIKELSAIPGEEEFLILPNTGFKVEDKKMNGNVLEIYLKCTETSLEF